MARQRDVRCGDCEKTSTLFVRRQVAYDLETGLECHPTECACGGAGVDRVVAGARTIDQGDIAGVGGVYPYYDRMLGCVVDSSAHRRRLCRERGLVAVEGDLTDKDFSVGFAEEEAALARYRAYGDRLENDPDFRSYRELRDKGYFKDQQQMAREG